MRTSPEMSNDRACCAHLRVSYRTEDVEHDFGPPRDDSGMPGPSKAPSGIHRLTRGWWECDSGCGRQFQPAAFVPQNSEGI